MGPASLDRKDSFHGHIENELQRLCSKLSQNETRAGKKAAISDSDFEEISVLLRDAELGEWSHRPRIYAILRTMGRLNYMFSFITEGLFDNSFPYPDRRSLPAAMIGDPDASHQFLDLQNQVLSAACYMEKGADSRHLSVESGDKLFEKIGVLGKGGEGSVDHVRSKLSRQVYARKRMRRKVFKKDKEVIEKFENELALLKRLDHHHLIKLRGSYTDYKYVALLMDPVADMDFKQYLSKQGGKNQLVGRERERFRTYYGCLASAVAYLHDQKVRHKDIKPSNILLKRGELYITDFGMALDFAEGESMTRGHPLLITPQYQSPEMARNGERGTKSDIWSLGLVFLEMTTVLRGHTLESMKNFIPNNGTNESFVYENIEGAILWTEYLRTHRSYPRMDNSPMQWIKDMLQKKATARPSAVELCDSIKQSADGAFFGKCCRDDESSWSETSSDGESDNDKTILASQHNFGKTKDERLSTSDVARDENQLRKTSDSVSSPTTQKKAPWIRYWPKIIISRWSKPAIAEYGPIISTPVLQNPPTAILSDTEDRYAIEIPGSFPSNFQESSSQIPELIPGPQISDKKILKQQEFSETPFRTLDSLPKIEDTLSQTTETKSDSHISKGGFSEQKLPIEAYIELPGSFPHETSRQIVEPKLKPCIIQAAMSKQESILESSIVIPATDNVHTQDVASRILKPNIETNTSDTQSHQIFSETSEESNEQVDTLGTATIMPEDHESSLPVIQQGQEILFGLGVRRKRRESEPNLDIYQRTRNLLSFSQRRLSDGEFIDHFDIPRETIMQHLREFAATIADISPSTIELAESAIARDQGGSQLEVIESEVSTPAPTTSVVNPEVSTIDIREYIMGSAYNVPAPTTSRDTSAPSESKNKPIISQATSSESRTSPDNPLVARIKNARGQSTSSPKSSSGHGLTKSNLAALNQATSPRKSPPMFKLENTSFYMKKVYNDAESVATSVMSSKTRERLKLGGLALALQDRSLDFLGQYARAGTASAVRLLLQEGCNPGTIREPRLGPIFAVIRGASARHTKCLKALIQYGVNVNVRDPKTGKTPLTIAIEQDDWPGYVNVIFLLLKAGAKPNMKDKSGDVPLLKLLDGGMQPLEEHHRAAIAVLLSPICDTDVQVTPIGTNNKPLHLAIRRSDPWAVGMILEKNVSVESPNSEGLTPIQLAATFWGSDMSSSQLKILDLLLQKDANVNRRMDDGTHRTPLHVAVSHGLLDAVERLIKHGADPSLRTKQRKSATNLAYERKRQHGCHGCLDCKEIIILTRSENSV